MRDFCRFYQRLAWNASRPSAIAADPLLLNQRNSRPELRSKSRADEAARPSTDDDEIVTIAHAFSTTATSEPGSSRCTKSSAMTAIANVP